MSTSLSDALREFLKDRDVECPGCGYNVRDLPGDHCPECNQQLELALKLSEPKQGALITGLVGLSAGAGLGGLLLIFWLIMVLEHHAPARGPFDSFFFINFFGFLIHAAGLLLWIWKWKVIRTTSELFRRWLVIVCCMMPLAFIVIFTAFVR